MNWSSEYVELATTLHGQHLTAQGAADEFNRVTDKNITRCAIIGKWRRLGLRSYNKKPPAAKVRRIRPAKRGERVLPVPPPIIEHQPSSGPCTLMDLSFYNQCRWVISDPRVFPVFYCGDQRVFPGDGSGRHKYCRFHGRMAYSPSRPR